MFIVGRCLPTTMKEATTKAGLANNRMETIDNTHDTNMDTTEAEKKLLRKCDLRVLPPLFVLFLLAFLDRTNIGTTSVALRRL
jgi:hypothetical protein